MAKASLHLPGREGALGVILEIEPELACGVNNRRFNCELRENPQPLSGEFPIARGGAAMVRLRATCRGENFAPSAQRASFLGQKKRC